MNIKMKLKNKPYCNELHFFLFAIVLTILSVYHYFICILLIIYLIFIFKKTKLFIPIVSTILIFLISMYIQKVVQKVYDDELYRGEFVVEELKDNYIIIKEKIKVVVYTKDIKVIPGDVIDVELKLSKIENGSYYGDFDSKLYYQSKRIYNSGKIIDYEIVGTKITINNLKFKIRNFFKSKLEIRSFEYLDAIIFGNNEIEDEVNKSYKSLYISHILTISGMHIMFFYYLLTNFFKKFFSIDGEFISTSLIFLYVLLLGFPVSATRSFLFLLISLFNKVGYIKYTKLDILSISFIFMVIINPFIANQTGFVLTYLISFSLIFMNEFTDNLSKNKKGILNSLICILVSLPIVINMNNKIAILGIIFSVFLSIFLPKLLLSIGIIMLIFPNKIYEYVFIGLNKVLIILSNNALMIRFPQINIIEMLIYYAILVFILICMIKKDNIVKSFIVLVIYLICVKNVCIMPYYKITFIDVGQGDSTLIQTHHGKRNILIDSYNNLDYLESLGTNHIDYIFISHFDKDHVSTLNDIIDDYKVKMIYYSEKSVTEEYIKNDNWINLNAGDELNIEGVRISVLGPLKDYNSLNLNSLVLKIYINSNTFLFTGDINEEVELDLIDIYESQLKSDVLKVAHHGSKTSSSISFLDYVKPKYSIISVSNYNNYGLPNDEILQRLDKYSKLYLTKNNGNITFKIYENNMKVLSFR